MASILDSFCRNKRRCCTPDDGTCEQKKARRWGFHRPHPPGHAFSAPLFLAPELNSLITGRPPASPDMQGSQPQPRMPRDRPYQELETNEKPGCCTKVSVNASKFGQIRRRPASFGLRFRDRPHIPLPVLHEARMPALFTGSLV